LKLWHFAGAFFMPDLNNPDINLINRFSKVE